jgi:hypothetical protein
VYQNKKMEEKYKQTNLLLLKLDEHSCVPENTDWEQQQLADTVRQNLKDLQVLNDAHQNPVWNL